MLADGIAILDKEIYNAQKAASEPDNINHLVSIKSDENAEKGFERRQHVHNPGTKEAWEYSLHKENRVLQLVEEGDLW